MWGPALSNSIGPLAPGFALVCLRKKEWTSWTFPRWSSRVVHHSRGQEDRFQCLKEEKGGKNITWAKNLLIGQPNSTGSSKHGVSVPQGIPNPVWHSHCGCPHLREGTKSDKIMAGALPDKKATGLGARDTHRLSSLLTIQIALEGKQRRPAGEQTGSFSRG